MTDTNASLQACPVPWCQHALPPRVVSYTGPAGRLRWYVLCETCELDGPTHPAKAEAIAAWNTRTPPESSEPSADQSFTLNIGDLLDRMDAVIEGWDEDEPREDWWDYQRYFLEARDILAVVNEGPPVKAVSGTAATPPVQS